MIEDADLLSRFVASGDERAFRAIVERHAAMVYGVALRRTQDQALAEEITQTVFTLFARKATALRHMELAGWLHRTAFLETRNVCRKEAHRREALRELSQQMIPDTSPDIAWRDLAPHLDEAMAGLSASDRQLVVMRYFEQRSYREISVTTGRSEEASRKQMERSLDRLGSHLRRHGVISSGSALGIWLAQQTLCIPPASAAAISAAALQSAATLTRTTLFLQTLTVMSTSIILKTAAVTLTLLLAAIPAIMAGRKIQQLKEENRRLRTVQAASGAPFPTEGTRSASLLTASIKSDLKPTAEPQPKDAGPTFKLPVSLVNIVLPALLGSGDAELGELCLFPYDLPKDEVPRLTDFLNAKAKEIARLEVDNSELVENDKGDQFIRIKAFTEQGLAVRDLVVKENRSAIRQICG